MPLRALKFSAACLLLSASGLAQQPPGGAPATHAAAPARSHVERFSTPEMRAERVEAEATARIAAHPNDARAHNLRGLARLRAGRYKEAHEDLRRASAIEPNNAEYLADLGSALWKLGRREEAIAAERAALKLDGKNFTARYQLGQFLLRAGGTERVREAAEHLRRAVELEPRQYEVRFELIGAYRALGERAQASTQLDLLWDARPSDPRVFYQSALLATDRGDMEAAVKDFREALRRDPALLAARRDLGLAYGKLGRWPEAVETFAELARRQPDSVEAAYLHALALYNVARAADAEREARRALRLNAGAAEAHTLLGVILAARGDANAEAAESLTQALALNPESFDARFYLGRVLYAQKDHAGAAEHLRAAVRLSPRHPEARFFLGTALESAGDSEGAMAQYRELVNAAPRSPYGLIGAGALLVKQGKLAEAIETLRRASALDAKNFETHWALGRALALAERHAEAVESFRAAIALAPRRADARYQLGLALRRAGRAEEAAREFAVVDKLNTEFRTGAAPATKKQ